MILKPKDLRVGDVVCYYRKSGERSPFGDMRVHREEGSGIYLRRPFIKVGGEVAYEELWWNLDSNFQFQLVQRD